MKCFKTENPREKRTKVEENHMSKKSKVFTITWMVGMMLFIFLLAGCAGEEKIKEIPITDLIDLSPSNIAQIRLSRGDVPQTIIENPEQLEEICSFLSSAFTLENQYKEFRMRDDVVGGIGDYILIRYSSNASVHIQISKNEQDQTAAGILIMGRIKEGEIKDNWRNYRLVNFSEQERLNEIFSMEPIK